MRRGLFRTDSGEPVTGVTAAEMRAVDRVAVEEFGIALLQMMENAGRALAWHARDVAPGPVTVVAVSALARCVPASHSHSTINRPKRLVAGE